MNDLLRKLAAKLEAVPDKQWEKKGIYYATTCNSQEVLITTGFNPYGGIATWVDVQINGKSIFYGSWLFWPFGLTRRFMKIHRRVERGLHRIASEQAMYAVEETLAAATPASSGPRQKAG